MSEHLESTSTLHSETLTNNTSGADGVASDLRINFEYDDRSEKPILLELGATPNTSSRNTSEHLAILPPTNNYPLEFHLNSAFSSVLPTLSHAYNIDRALLFNNPYNSNRITTTATSQISQAPSPHPSSTSSLISRNTMPYSGHIPQTVYSWSPPTIPPSITLTDVNDKLTTEIVPPPVYMTYSESREHTITKRSNYSRKEKLLQNETDYKRTACDRERTRMRDMNRAFDLLRSKLPITKPNGKKYSKIESLRIAINYIKHLQTILEDNTTDQMNLAAVKCLNDLNVRRRTNLYHSESHKSSSIDDANGNERFENLDESRSTWSDSYMPNSQDKWE